MTSVLDQDFSALFQRGLLAAQARRLEEATALFDDAIALEPHQAAAHGNRGTVLMERRSWEAALASFDRAIALKPDYAVAYCNRGNVLKELCRWDEALANYDQAITLNPHLAQAYSNRGNVQRELQQLAAALESCERAIDLDPSTACAHLNRGIVLRELGQWDAALASYERAIAIDTHYAEAFSNRGVVLHDLMRIDEALASYDRAIQLQPGLAAAHFNRSLAALARGDLADGFSGYEWRFQLKGGLSHPIARCYPQSRWRGTQSLRGKTLLLYGEQGLGDTLQFCRYVATVAQLGARVILEAPESLSTLLASLEGLAAVVRPGAALPPFDYHCALLSLPHLLGTTVDTVPRQTPYLAVGVDKRQAWRQRLGETHKRRIGLVWSGGFRPDQPELWPVNQRRNIPLSLLAPLKHDGIEFYSLQKGEPAESELARLVAQHWNGPPLKDFTHLLHDFADTAALIEQLDLVIAVDTSTAHLAGALGKPVWLLNRFDSCWRWLCDRADSPWYPTLTIYRQRSPGNWADVIQRVRQDL